MWRTSSGRSWTCGRSQTFIHRRYIVPCGPIRFGSGAFLAHLGPESASRISMSFWLPVVFMLFLMVYRASHSGSLWSLHSLLNVVLVSLVYGEVIGSSYGIIIQRNFLQRGVFGTTLVQSISWRQGYWVSVKGTKGQEEDCVSDGSLLSNELHGEVQWADYKMGYPALCSGWLLKCTDIHHQWLMALRWLF